jgi:hypothetical protein
MGKAIEGEKTESKEIIAVSVLGSPVLVAVLEVKMKYFEESTYRGSPLNRMAFVVTRAMVKAVVRPEVDLVGLRVRLVQKNWGTLPWGGQFLGLWTLQVVQ